MFFFFNDTATTEIYTLSLHDALPICFALSYGAQQVSGIWSWVRDDGHVEKAFDFSGMGARNGVTAAIMADRKSTRLNSSHQIISYAVFCLKKKNTTTSN